MNTTDINYKCTCDGCTGRTADFNSVWQWRQIPDRIQGHYFDESTRRFFRSRINGWRHMDCGGLAVRESLAGDFDNTFRVHCVVLFCKYGNLVYRSDKFTTGKKAAEHMAGLYNTVHGCECHGCEIDRTERH